jgi:Tfp pilus assembly protein PilN
MAINLIPPKLKKQKELHYISSQIIFGLFVILVMIGIMAGALFVYDSFLTKDIARNNDNLADQTKRLKSFQDTKISIEDANTKLANVDSVLTDRITWSEIITKIASYTPKNVQIKTMELKKTANGGTISGLAVTRKDIALFKEKLETNGFNNVTFTSSSYNSSTDDYTFSLSLEIGGK